MFGVAIQKSEAGQLVRVGRFRRVGESAWEYMSSPGELIFTGFYLFLVFGFLPILIGAALNVNSEVVGIALFVLIFQCAYGLYNLFFKDLRYRLTVLPSDRKVVLQVYRSLRWRTREISFDSIDDIWISSTEVQDAMQAPPKFFLKDGAEVDLPPMYLTEKKFFKVLCGGGEPGDWGD